MGLEVQRPGDKYLMHSCHQLCDIWGLRGCSAILPGAKGAALGKLPRGPQWDKAAGEAARTIPGRENGGNCDIKNLTRGCKVSVPAKQGEQICGKPF